MSGDDYDDPTREAQWLVEQRANVERYLKSECLLYCGVASESEWFLAPYVSVWIIESLRVPGAIGWWVISGDLPTDYLSGNDATDARSALAAFANCWREASAYMLRGEDCPKVRIGRAWNRRELGDLLRRGG
jgi:hypothetical protein